ncbi:MAG: MFS transporter [Anaerolineae bacterium]|nr:MFS transporter [Anaerolineae bacterium]
MIPEPSPSVEPVPTINDRRYAKTAGYYMIFIVLGLTTAVVGPTLTGLADNTQTPIGGMGLVFTVSSLGYLVGSLLGGQIYDRTPGHPLLIGMIVGLAAITALIPMTSWLALLLVLMAASGFGQGILDVGCNTLLVWVHRDKVAPFMNGLHFFFGVGSSISPIIVAQAFNLSGGISWGYWILAILAAPIALWMLPLSSPSSPAATPEEQIAKQIDYRLVLMASLLLFLYVGAEIGFGGWIATYAVARGLASLTDAAYLTSLFWGVFTVGRLLSIPMAARARPRFILSGDLLGCLVSLGIILLWSDSLTATWIGTAGLGLFMASVFPTVINLAARRMNLTGRIMSCFFVGASLGSASLPWLIGRLFEDIGPQVMLWAILADLLLMVGIFLVTISYSERPRHTV